MTEIQLFVGSLSRPK